MERSREQKLIDLMFEIAMRLRMGDAKFSSNEECGKWVARQLLKNGFPTEPCGSSWGVLTERTHGTR